MGELKWENGCDVRVVGIDVDGTLLRSDKRVSDRVGEAVRAVMERGVEVVLASARPPRGLRWVHEHLGLETVQINYNGALIWDAGAGRELYHRPLEGAVAGEIVAFAREVDTGVVVSLEVLDRWYTDRVDPELLTETARHESPHYVGPLDRWFEGPVTKLMLLGEPGRLTAVREAVEVEFGERVGLMVSDEHLLQVVHGEVDKGRALRWVSQRMGAGPGQVMAIGDAPNDAAMLRWAGLGVAVENAWAEAREAADVVVPGNDADGVAVALERYVLGG